MNDNLLNRQVLYGPAVPLFNYNHNHDPKNGQFTSGDGSGNNNALFTATGGNNPRQQGAIHRALNLPLNPNTDSKNGSGRNPFISHYGGDWDEWKDSNSNPAKDSGKKPTGDHDNTLNSNSLAISTNVAKDNHLVKGKGVYINGQYIGNYDDTPRDPNRIDVYDPNNVPNNKGWGGTVRGGARVTSGPPH